MNAEVVYYQLMSQLPKLDVAGSIPVSRSFLFSQLQLLLIRRFAKAVNWVEIG
jgi:hypothetical protein